MKFVVENPAIKAEEIDRAVSGMLNDSHREDFRDISEWMIKTGLNQEGAKERLIKEISERVSKEITEGVVQITVQTLEEETTIKANIEKKLPEFYPRIDFVVKSGAIDLETLTYYFKVGSKVTLDNLAVVLKKEEIIGIRSGNLQAFVTLAFCGKDWKNPDPFILFKEKKIFDIDLEKAIKFGEPKAS